MKKISKYIFSLLFSLGYIFSDLPKPTLVYTCTGTEDFPVFFGSPFIYKSSSMVSSGEYDFYFFGLAADLILWTLVILILRLVLLKILSRLEKKWVLQAYRKLKHGLAILFMAWTLFSIYVHNASLTLHADIDGQSQTWGMTCRGQADLHE